MADEIIQRNQINEDVITLVAEGRQFMCHKSKLMASSDYFRAMFSNNFIEHAQDTIELQGIDADCLLLLLQYVESGSYVIPSDNVLALLQTAAMLQFISVQIACEQQVLASLSCDTCLEVYFVTSTLGLSNIATAALTIAVWKFLEIVKKPQFHHLSLSEMVEYISHPALFLGPNGEWTVWEALISWIEENEAERTEHLLKLLLCLDFYSLTREDISNMLFYNIVSENNEAVQLLEGIGKYKMAHLQQRLSCQNQDMELMKKETSNSVEKQTNPEKHDSDKDSEEHEVRTLVESAVRHSKRHIPRVPCIVGFKQSHSSQRKKEAKNSDDDDDADLIWSFRKRNLENIPVIYSLNPVTKKITEEITLTKLCDGPVQCSGYQVCSVGPSIYILGGEYQLGHGNWNQSLWRYSTVSKKWIVENSLPQPRRHHMVCVVDSIIYILGGYGKHRIVQSSVNAYDTESGDWLHCPDMPHCVSQGAACAFKGRLMVFTQEMQLLTYYPTMKKWSAIPVRSPSIQGYRAALTWENSVYLIDTVENLPDEVQREISSMRELDVRYQALLQDMEGLRGQLEGELDSMSLKRIMVQIQDKLISTQEIGDDKLQIVQHILDLIENRQRQLELDCKNLDFGQEQEKPEASKEVQPERASKRARRTRNDHATNNENSNDAPVIPHVEKVTTNKGSTQKKTTKKKKRKARVEREREDSPTEIPIDPDEPTYCLCEQVSYGEMIGCDNDLCPIEWFHFSCVGLTNKPKGKWFCPKCRGDKPTVMKPRAQFLKELEKYNKEKEEKS